MSNMRDIMNKLNESTISEADVREDSLVANLMKTADNSLKAPADDSTTTTTSTQPTGNIKPQGTIQAQAAQAQAGAAAPAAGSAPAPAQTQQQRAAAAAQSSTQVQKTMAPSDPKKAAMLTNGAKSNDVFTKHQVNIAKQTLKMSDAGALIAGGMSKDKARDVLKKAGLMRSKVKEEEITERSASVMTDKEKLQKAFQIGAHAAQRDLGRNKAMYNMYQAIFGKSKVIGDEPNIVALRKEVERGFTSLPKKD